MLDALLPGVPPGTVQPARVTAPLPACPSWLTPVRALVAAHATTARGLARGGGSGRVSAGARAEGKRFERKVLADLVERFPFLLVEPGFAFRDAFGARFCYPDALLRFNDATVIVEIKHRGHQLGDAWWQLERYYRPVIEAVYPADPVRSLAIVRAVDPAVRVPGAAPVDWRSFSDWRSAPEARFGVMEWRSA